MALPSSNPRNSISVGVQAPNVALQPYDPNVVTNNFNAGYDTTQKVLDGILIRPRLEAAQLAQAKLAQEQASAATANVPAQANAQAAIAAATTSAANVQDNSNKQDLHLLDDAEFQQNVFDGKLAVAKNNALVAKRELLTAPEADKEAILKAQKRVRDTQYDFDTLTDEQKVRDLDRISRHGSGVVQAADATAKSDAVQAPGVVDAMAAGNKAAIVDNVLQQRLKLAQDLAYGAMAPGRITPEQDADLRKAAQAKGVNIFDASGAPRVIQDVSKDYSSRVNLDGAQKTLEDLRTQAASAASSLQSYTRVKQLLGGNVGTGYLYGSRVGAFANGIASEFGSKNAAVRQELESIQNQLVPAARGGLPGSASDRDVANFKSSLPGPDKSHQVNANIITGAVALQQRVLDKQKFYSDLAGKLPLNEIDSAWSQYINTNEIFDNTASSPSNPVLNQRALSPQQYLGALQDPLKTAKSLAPDDPKELATLRPGSTPEELAAAPSGDPFLKVKGARGVTAIPNPKYWRPIVDSSARIFNPVVNSAAGNAAVANFSTALNTPIDSLIQPVTTGGLGNLILRPR